MPVTAPPKRRRRFSNIARVVVALAMCGGAVGGAPYARGATPAPLATTEIGQGPALVFVSGLGEGRMTWMPTARKLFAGHRIVLVDLPGQGDSPMPAPFTLDAAAAALDELLARQNAESTIVIGHGMGGLLAALVAKSHPERMKGLVLIDVTMKFPVPIADQQKKLFLGWMEENFDDFMKRVFGNEGRDSVQSAEIYAQAMLVPKTNLIAYFRAYLGADATGALAGFDHPILYVGSERAWPADKPWPALALERGMSGLTVDTLRMPASARLIMKDRPDSLAAAIRGFAARALGPGTAISDHGE